MTPTRHQGGRHDAGFGGTREGDPVANTFSAMNSQPLLISLLAIVGLSATGCMKEFTCGCTDFDNGPYYYTVEARTEEAARELCETPGGDCALQE